MELTILILLLPFFSFLILGIGGKWMSHRTAGTIGTLILGAVAVLSYVTAIQYFSAPRLEDGTFATLMPYNFTWLPFTETLHFDLGNAKNLIQNQVRGNRYIQHSDRIVIVVCTWLCCQAIPLTLQIKREIM